MALSYFINRKKSTCVISLKGSLTTNDVDILELCLREATEISAKYYILNCGGLREVESSVTRPFTLFQQGLRTSATLYLCGVPTEPERILKSVGVLRDSEIQPDLITCLQAILNQEKD